MTKSDYTPQVTVTFSRDEADRAARWQAIIDEVAAMDRCGQLEVTGFLKGLLDGWRIGQQVKAERQR